MTASGDVVVVGGGALGSACAWGLARAGARVTVLHHGPGEGEAWRAAAGMLAAQLEPRPDSPLFNFGIAGRSFYRRAVPELEQATGIDLGFKECGILQVAQREAQVEEFKTRVGWQRQQGHQADWLDPDEVRHTYPWLGLSLGGFWSPEDGLIDPVALVEALRLDAVAHGARLVDDTAVGLDRHGSRLQGVIGASGRYQAATVLLAGGAWAGRLEGLPRPLSVEPVRGQMAAFPWPEGIPSAVIYGDMCYLLRRGNELLAGTTKEHTGFAAATTTEGIAEIRERLATLYPPAAARAPLRTWAGLRPGTPDGLPILGPEPLLPGLWYAAGDGRNGILLAGITGDLLTRAIGGEPLGADVLPLRPERFWNW
jgi:glycine oxidase